ncbi:unnamed protein product, partial [Heterosigma akashiwo]
FEEKNLNEAIVGDVEKPHSRIHDKNRHSESGGSLAVSLGEFAFSPSIRR